MGFDTLTKRKNLLRWARRRAEEQSVVFNITLDDIIIPPVCPVLGIPIRCGSGSSTDNSPTLDKIVPELGYVSGNVVVISNRANRLKSNASWFELKRLADFFENLIRTRWMQ
jgi:hypothetical protein